MMPRIGGCWRAGARPMAAVLLAGVALSACVSLPRPYAVSASTPEDRGSPAGGGRHTGTEAPYQIDGKWYYPKSDPHYDRVGVASWYGQQFHNHRTADGEIFDQYAPSAAHKTLPLPSLIEVTNLDNGRRIKVRLNDRGPFVGDRILDLSHAAAKELGFEAQGTAHVRVRYLGPAPTQVVRAPAYDPLPPMPSFEPPSAPTGVYAVQAGAFADRANAERVAAQLGDAGMAAVQPLERNGATLYRVVVGGFNDQAAAVEARRRVAALGFPDAKVTGPS